MYYEFLTGKQLKGFIRKYSALTRKRLSRRDPGAMELSEVSDIDITSHHHLSQSCLHVFLRGMQRFSVKACPELQGCDPGFVFE